MNRPFRLTPLTPPKPAPASRRPLADDPGAALALGPRRLPRAARLLTAIRQRWPLIAVVIAPTLLTAIYFFGFAADQYESEAHFMVRASQPLAAPTMGIGQLFGLGAPGQSPAEALSIADYLNSHDAVAAANRKLNLAAIFRRPEADLLSRLSTVRPDAETLLKYYRRQVHVTASQDTGKTVLTVHAFRAGDARQLAEALLELGEQRVNQFNARAEAETVRASEAELAGAEAELRTVQAGLTNFRSTRGDMDPEKTAAAQLQLVVRLQEQLVQYRAQLASMAGFVSRESPQRVALAARVNALEAQVGAERARLAGASEGMAPRLGGYEDLQLRQELAGKRYAAAAAAVASAREAARKQQLFVVRVVEPNLPEKALFPRRWLIVASVFVTLLLSYGVGWLIFAGVREHAA
jgi:capsular polysaccharide transport system permease protein